MNSKTLILLAVAMGLWSVSHALELRGDAIPMTDGAAAAERAKYHVMALVALTGALGSFVYAGVSAFRTRR